MTELYNYYKVDELIKNKYCNGLEESNILRTLMLDHIKQKMPLHLDFEDVLEFSRFCMNEAFAKLLTDVSREDIKTYIKILNMKPKDLLDLRQILSNSMHHQKVKKKLDKAMAKVEFDQKPKWEQKLIKQKIKDTKRRK